MSAENRVRDKVLAALEALQEEGVDSVRFWNESGKIEVKMDNVYSVVNLSDEDDEEGRYIAKEENWWQTKKAELVVGRYKFYGEDFCPGMTPTGMADGGEK